MNTINLNTITTDTHKIFAVYDGVEFSESLEVRNGNSVEEIIEDAVFDISANNVSYDGFDTRDITATDNSFIVEIKGVVDTTGAGDFDEVAIIITAFNK